LFFLFKLRFLVNRSFTSDRFFALKISKFSIFFSRFFFVIMSFAWDFSFLEFSFDDNEKRDSSISMKLIRSSSKTCQRYIKFLTKNVIIVCHFDVDRFICHWCTSLNVAYDEMSEFYLIFCRNSLIMTDQFAFLENCSLNCWWDFEDDQVWRPLFETHRMTT
jgi:hypothetical protein